MKSNDIQEWLLNALPLKRKSSTDWVLPAFVGLGVGIAAGVGVGILFAPDAGEMTRLRLREGAYRMKDRAAQLADRARNQIASATSDESQRYVGSAGEMR